MGRVYDLSLVPARSGCSGLSAPLETAPQTASGRFAEDLSQVSALVCNGWSERVEAKSLFNPSPLGTDIFAAALVIFGAIG